MVNVDRGASTEWTFSDIEAEIYKALQTLDKLPDRESGWLRGNGYWPDILRDHHQSFNTDGEKERFRLSSRPSASGEEISHMTEWLEILAKSIGRGALFLKNPKIVNIIVVARIKRGYSYRQLSMMLWQRHQKKISHTTCKSWYEKALQGVVKRCNCVKIKKDFTN